MNFLIRLAAFVVAGPLIGMTTFFLFAGVLEGKPFTALFGTMLLMTFLAPFMLPMAYMFGGPAALAAGLVVAFVSPRVPAWPHRVLFAAMIGTLAGALLSIDPSSNAHATMPIRALAGGLAAAACSLCAELGLREAQGIDATSG
jgi:hypothetical protein